MLRYLYRYGFNGKENDNEVKGAGNQQDYGMRTYDPRIGKFLSVDPLTKGYPMLTPYQFASNTPIAAIDIDGKEAGIPLNGVGWSGTIISNYFDNEKGRELWSNTMGTGLLVGGAIVADVFITRGWITRTLLASQILGAFEHNRANNLEDRLAQDGRSKEALADAFFTWGGGKLLGVSFNVGVSALKGLAKNRFNFAKEFYQKAGFDETRMLSHTNGIDLTEKVFETTLKKGTKLEQWTYLDANGKPKLGDYFTFPGADPTILGIPLEGRVRTLNTLQEDTKFLQSKAADIENWTKPGEMLKGGEIQLFQTNVKTVIEN